MLYRIAITAAVAVALCAPALGAKPRKASTSRGRATISKTARSKAAPKKAVKGKSSRKYARTPARRYTARVSQRTPSPERYREIQQALAEKGHYSGPVNGVWGPECVDALRQFQREQGLAPDGKLGSLSLIALGLGPKRDAGGALAAKPLVPSQP